MNAFSKTRIRTPVFDQLCRGFFHAGNASPERALSMTNLPDARYGSLRTATSLRSTVGPQRGVERQVVSWYQLIEHTTE